MAGCTLVVLRKGSIPYDSQTCVFPSQVLGPIYWKGNRWKRLSLVGPYQSKLCETWRNLRMLEENGQAGRDIMSCSGQEVTLLLL